jgi:hypothetical protein
MKVSKKKLLLSLLALACIIAVVFTAVYYNTAETAEENPPQGNPPENPEEPQLVVPESPIGTLGLISALAAGFGTFTIIKKRR